MVVDEVDADDVRWRDVVVIVTMPVIPVTVLGVMLTVDEETVWPVGVAAVTVDEDSVSLVRVAAVMVEPAS